MIRPGVMGVRKQCCRIARRVPKRSGALCICGAAGSPAIQQHKRRRRQLRGSRCRGEAGACAAHVALQVGQVLVHRQRLGLRRRQRGPGAAETGLLLKAAANWPGWGAEAAGRCDGLERRRLTDHVAIIAAAARSRDDERWRPLPPRGHSRLAHAARASLQLLWTWAEAVLRVFTIHGALAAVARLGHWPLHGRRPCPGHAQRAWRIVEGQGDEVCQGRRQGA